MPAFTFEKISPPENRSPIPPVVNKKPRGVIVRILDRFVEARVKRSVKAEKDVSKAIRTDRPNQIFRVGAGLFFPAGL